MTAGRPIGGHIRNICTVLEEIGPANARTLMAHFPHVSRPNLHKYCTRAVVKGFITTHTSPCKYGATNIYTVVPEWRQLAEVRKPAAPKPQPKQSRWQGVNSVFSIGGL